MTNKQNITLRLTINVDQNQAGELAFIRAMLRRLNVTYAKTRPRSGLKEILGDNKLRDLLEFGRTRQRTRTGIVVPFKPVAEQPQKSLPAPSKKLEVEVKKFDPPKPKFRYIRLKEQRFDPPAWVNSGQVGGVT